MKNKNELSTCHNCLDSFSTRSYEISEDSLFNILKIQNIDSVKKKACRIVFQNTLCNIDTASEVIILSSNYLLYKGVFDIYSLDAYIPNELFDNKEHGMKVYIHREGWYYCFSTGQKARKYHKNIEAIEIVFMPLNFEEKIYFNFK